MFKKINMLLVFVASVALVPLMYVQTAVAQNNIDANSTFEFVQEGCESGVPGVDFSIKETLSNGDPITYCAWSEAPSTSGRYFFKTSDACTSGRMIYNFDETTSSGTLLVGNYCGDQNTSSWDSLTEIERRSISISNGEINTLVNADSNAGAGEDVDISCAGNSGAFGWIMCPVIEGTLGFINFMASLIASYLQVPPVQFDAESPQYQIWQSFRNIALGLMMIAMLVMVFGQALSLNIDAYTVKKMLPRIVIATIGVMLSIYLIAFAVDFFNVLGRGIADLVKAPLDGLDIAVGGFPQQATALVGLLAGGVAVFSMGISVFLLVVLVPVALAFLSVYLTLVVRQVVIIMLIIVAPIAFVLWTIPGTEKYAKTWWSTLFKALLMYPIIMLLLASGQVFAVILTNASNDSWLTTLTALVAIAVPMFLVPATFRMAGGAIAATGGFLQSQARNFGSQSRGKGMEKWAERRKKMAAGGNFNENKRVVGGVSKALNSLTGRVGSGPKGWVNKGVSDERQRVRLGLAAGGVAENPEFAARSVDEKFLVAQVDRGYANQQLENAKEEYTAAMAVANDVAETEEVRNSARTTASAKSADVDMWSNAITATKSTKQSQVEKFAAFQALMSAGRGFGEGETAHEFITTAAAGFAGSRDNAQFRSIMNEAQFRLDRAGRHDVGGINNGEPYSFDTGWNRANLYQLSTGKKETFKAANTRMQQLIQSGTQQDLGKAYVMHAELQQLLQNATGENRDEIVKILDNVNVTDIETRLGARVEPPPGGGTVDPKAVLAARDRKREILSRARTYQRQDDNRLAGDGSGTGGS